MKIYVENHATDTEKLYEGTPEHIDTLLLFDYPWLRTNDLADRGDLEGTLEHLDATQMYSVSTEKQDLSKSSNEPIDYAGDQLGYQPHLTSAFHAARFLSGKDDPSAPIRSMLWEADGDIRIAALRAFGLDANEENLAAMAAIEGMGQLSKSEQLSKGSVARIAPLDPNKAKATATGERWNYGWNRNEPTTLGEDLGAWSGGDAQARNRIADAHVPEVHARSLHRLHGLTQVRRSTTSGQREFLLHRGIGPDEVSLVHDGHYHGDTDASSWTPSSERAQRFVAPGGKLISAWVPESSVSTYLPILGSMHRGQKGPLESREEHEVVVKPGKFQLHVPGLSKAEQPSLAPPAPQSIVAAHPDGEDVAEEVNRAFKDNFVFEVMLSGKHSDGTLLARDQETGHSYLLKPGSGGQSSAAGVTEEHASQSQREAAWYQVAKLWGLYDAFPRAELLLIDSQQVAALQFLGTSYSTLGKLEDADPNLGRKAFLPYLQDGRLHEWAVLFFVLAETDGHAQNCMLNAENDVQFIDHGAAFAGPDFDPAHDRNSFVPCFLRQWAPKAFNGLSVEQKLEYMPKVNTRIRAELKAWLDSLHADALEHTLYRYGIDPSACLARLAKVKTLATEMPVDLAINRLWVTT